MKLFKKFDPVASYKADSTRDAMGGDWGNDADPFAEKLGLYNPQDLIDGISGKSSEKAQKEIMRIQGQTVDDQLAEQQRQFDITAAQQEPFLQAGLDAMPGVQDAATVEGYGGRISDIMGNQDINNVRNNIAGDYLQSVGLSPMNGMGDLNALEAMDIENMLNQRGQSIAGKGLTGANAMAGFGANKTNQISNILSNYGNTGANSMQNQAAARADGMRNIGTLAAVGLGSYFGNQQQGS